MKILWISQAVQSNEAGGTIGQTDRVEMPGLIARLGHQVKLIVGASPVDLVRGVKALPHSDVVYLPMIKRSLLTTLTFQSALAFILPFQLLRFAPDIVIVDYFSILSIMPWALLRKLGVLRTCFILDLRTLVVDVKGWRGRVSVGRFDLSLRFAHRFMDGITMITPRMRDDLSKRFGIPREQVGVWESGVNIEKFLSAKSRRDALGWTNKFVVLYHGTLSPNRGLQSTIAAIAELRSEYPDLLLCLLGAGPAWKELETLVKESRLEQVVTIHPPVPYAEVPDYIASADVGIIPLPDIEWWSTSSPLKLMEYLAAGKPVIVSRIAAHTAVLQASECAFYLRDVSPQAIKEGICHFHARRQDLTHLGAAGREIVRERFSWERQAEKLVEYVGLKCARNPRTDIEHGSSWIEGSDV